MKDEEYYLQTHCNVLRCGFLLHLSHLEFIKDLVTEDCVSLVLKIPTYYLLNWFFLFLQKIGFCSFF